PHPKMVDVAKNNRPNVTKYAPAPPSIVPKAEAVSTPASMDESCQSPDITRVISVMEQTLKVSIKTCVMETSACLPGKSVLAAAAAIGADPKPASLENNPRVIPNRMTAPTVPPAAALPENAYVKIVPSASGTRLIFMIITIKPAR